MNKGKTIDERRVNEYIEELIKNRKTFSFFIDGTLYLSSDNIPHINDKIEKVNKRITKQKEKDLIPQEIQPIQFSSNAIDENKFIEQINDILENPEKYDGRVSVNGSNLYSPMEEDGKKYLNKTLLEKLKNLREVMQTKPNVIKNFFQSINLSSLDLGVEHLEWSVLGVIQPFEDTYTVSSFHGEEIPEKYLTMHSKDCANCDHCKINRERGNVFILKNEKTDETLQVGGSCLDSYINKNTLKILLSIRESLFPNRDGEYAGKKHVELVNKKMAITAAFSAVRKFDKYISQKNDFYCNTKTMALYNSSFEYQHLITKMFEQDLRGQKLTSYEKKEKIRVFKETMDLNITEEDYKMTEKVLKYYKDLPLNNDEFDFNTRNLLNSDSDFIPIQKAGFLAYAVYKYYQHDIEKNKNEALLKEGDEIIELSPYIAPEKTKFEAMEFQFKSFKINDGIYGMTYKLTLEADNGIRAIVSLSNPDKLPKEFDDDENSSRLKSVNDINEKFRGQYLTISGSISQNVAFKGDSGNIIKYSKIRLNSVVGDITKEPKNNPTTLKEKVVIHNLKCIGVNQGTYLRDGKFPIDLHQYVFALDGDDDKNKYIITSKLPIPELQENGLYRIPTTLIDNPENRKDGTIHLISPQNGIIVPVREFKERNDKPLTPKQLEKELKSLSIPKPK